MGYPFEEHAPRRVEMSANTGKHIAVAESDGQASTGEWN
jgi:hypothetical protein